MAVPITRTKIQTTADDVRKIISESVVLTNMKNADPEAFENIDLGTLNELFNKTLSNDDLKYKNCVLHISMLYKGYYPHECDELFFNLIILLNYLKSSREMDLQIIHYYDDNDIDILENFRGGTFDKSYLDFCRKLNDPKKVFILKSIIKFGSLEYFISLKCPICDCLIYACKLGKEPLIKYLYSIGQLDINDDCVFIALCYSGNLDLVKWFYELNPNMSKDVFKLAFKTGCESGNLELVKWMYELRSNKTKKILVDTKTFKAAMFPGNLELVQWILDLKYDFKIDLQDAFSASFHSKNYKICELVYNKCMELNLEIIVNKSLFDHSVLVGNFQTTKWLWSLKKISINELSTSDFYDICECGDFDYIQWIWNLLLNNGIVVDIHADYEYAFTVLCRSGNLEAIKWLWDLAETMGCKITLYQGGENVDDANPLLSVADNMENSLTTFKWVWDLYLKEHIVIDKSNFDDITLQKDISTFIKNN